MGVVVRRYIDFIKLLILTPLVSVPFCSSIPTFCSFISRDERLNILMLLHIHKERTDLLDLKTIINEFSDCLEHHCKIFVKF